MHNYIKCFGLVSSSLTMALLLFRYKAYTLSAVGPFKLTTPFKPVLINVNKDLYLHGR